MGAILALHLAAEFPLEVHATTLFAPTLKLDDWGVPWYSVFFNLVRSEWCQSRPLCRARTLRYQDPRVRALVTAAINSGDSSKAGQLTNPGRVMLEMRRLVAIVRRQLRRIHQPTLIVHPRHDDRASLGNAAYLQASLGERSRPACSMLAITSSRCTVSAISLSSARLPSPSASQRRAIVATTAARRPGDAWRQRLRTCTAFPA
jgi:pimeloyl-ACP methyl ester carboxylesterase